ncbi:MAG TPA: hypothetical protein DD637_06655 [Verrucomicrobia bacterium]|nr:hypothetical protein [Verrucomicrobiota bacterium]HCG19683.1 hypothetical protein [Verrucomicrobiota bacterium]
MRTRTPRTCTGAQKTDTSAMSNAVREFLHRISRQGVRRRGRVTTATMGIARVFQAWDVGEDTFIFERGIGRRLKDRPSVLIAEKRALARGATGYVLTMSTGNHAIAAFPLLDGRFWGLSHLASHRRGEALMRDILCANVVDGRLEVAQRDVPAKTLFAADAWLLGPAGLSMADVVLTDRTDAAIEHYHRLGQEWRVKALAWTANEIRTALAAARKHISTRLNYYHSARGVHFLTYPEFRLFAARAHADLPEFVRELKEMVSVCDGNLRSYTRLPKYHGHHEIELFGLRRGEAQTTLVPQMERLMEAIELGRIAPADIARRADELDAEFKSRLVKGEYADEGSPVFAEALYMCITGEVYLLASDGVTTAFDDRRTALPGATFAGGRPFFQPGCDARSEIIFANLRGLMSKDESIEYANIYEIREDAGAAVGKGRTREIVYKTDRCPLEKGLVVKSLAHSARGYASFMLSRIGLFRALGMSLAAFYKMLRRRFSSHSREVDYYIRTRCAGETLRDIPESYFRSTDDASVEEREVVLALAGLMGDAAAQNMAMKKYDASAPDGPSPLYDVGKEIYAFEYDIAAGRILPKSVATCSIRGSMAWPDLSFTEENLKRLAAFYMASYAHALKAFQKKHQVPMPELAERFFGGFEHRTHAMAWSLSVHRDEFESFNPDIPSRYRFDKKRSFLLWSLMRQERRLETLKQLFFARVAAEEKENA